MASLAAARAVCLGWRLAAHAVGFMVGVACRWRLRHAGADGRGSSGLACQVVHGDMWSVAWSGFDLVYVFQRPESMQRAWDKACREMPEGSWLVSLEFEVPGLAPAVQLTCPDGRFVWIYRICENRNSVGVPIGR